LVLAAADQLLTEREQLQGPIPFFRLSPQLVAVVPVHILAEILFQVAAAPAQYTLLVEAQALLDKETMVVIILVVDRCSVDQAAAVLAQ
jgi:hypothetical protein